ncbi:pyruvate kinase [Mechercharimyces sp. CAU 1602]|uniref:pyruvate kinase n=1 Tax=Mechercharimyces sp. CAU 1602 TaxID=2973933 RepID=UPI0021616650|nr:pyruvate kinase [Mechercharimyces sp. CAU 1602]MCS1351613.1 pyruvate kinase [Mechercharimyces sp. CAU 1602]
MRKTKIVCTIGPASESVEELKKLMKAGMNVARLNFSHGTHEEHRERIRNIRQAAAEAGCIVSILLDTKGPEIRTGKLSRAQEGYQLEEGAQITLTTEEILGDQHRVSITYHQLPQDVKKSDLILVDDGLIRLQVTKVEGTEIYCKVLNSGRLKEKKGVNVPGVKVNLPGITEKDADDLRFGIAEEVDFIAASFVRKAEDILDLRRILEQTGADIPVISKIENQEALEHLDEILMVSDGLMVARGDLGVEIPAEEVPLVQKELIQKCNRLGKPVITATQMLDSMERNPRPTRAEASDVANAILDGTDAIMLSGETAIGKYPEEAVLTMGRIAERTESSPRYRDSYRARSQHHQQSVTDIISQSVVHSTEHLPCSAIVCPTESGYTAQLVSKYRPHVPIIAVTPHEKVLRKLTLAWGVYSVKGKHVKNTDEMLQRAIESALQSELVKMGDVVVITAGVPVGTAGSTNFMKVHIIGDMVASGQGIGGDVVTGKVVTGTTVDEILEKMNEGDILVTMGTDRDLMPALEKAKAIITEEGGLTSHAAVVGLSLGIPVVVGVNDATQKLKDGMEITLDGQKGRIFSGRANVL